MRNILWEVLTFIVLTKKSDLAFFADITQKMQNKGMMKRNKGDSGKFNLSLYVATSQESIPVSWNWILDAFEQAKIETNSAPKAVMIIEHNNIDLYAVTFGHSFFLVDKFCDRNFGFDFARKLEYEEIKTTTLTTPGSYRNKTVNTYIDYSELEFDSGESFAKLKAKVKVEKGFSLHKPSIEIGSSIRFSVDNDSVDKILDLILYIEHKLKFEADRCKIPVFTKISDKSLLTKLNQNMESSIGKNPAQINISELDIIGATEVFNNNDSEFSLRFRGKEKKITSLSNEEIEQFCKENHLDYAESILNISVIRLSNGSPVKTSKVRDLIDYTDDTENCILSKGIWYRYNTDYLNYLKDSISEIECEYHPEYDFSEKQHSDFIATHENLTQDKSKGDKETKDKLRAQYYAERVFNMLRQENDGFKIYDREVTHVGDNTVELMDLYKDDKMFSVKIGNTSGKLCYTVDQSITTLKLLRQGKLADMPNVSTIVLWFVLKKHKHIEDQNNHPDINKLKMLLLKIRLDQWKRKCGYRG